MTTDRLLTRRVIARRAPINRHLDERAYIYIRSNDVTVFDMT
jgi:hypothetical protein